MRFEGKRNEKNRRFKTGVANPRAIWASRTYANPGAAADQINSPLKVLARFLSLSKSFI
jgi:hypothetical protein